MLTHLILMRHAKSSWDDPMLDDHERPLNRRGREGADAIGQALHAKGLAPDTIWCSSATRTRETGKRLMRIIPGPQSVVTVPDFYHATVDQILSVLAGETEPDGKLMLLGHNPGLEGLVEYYTGDVRRVPTAGTLVLSRKAGDFAWWERQSWAALDWLTPKSL